MSLIGTTRQLERNQFFNGQRLFASDLQAVEEFNREMRWLHNQTLHQPGIGSGLATTGKKGDREVTIEPGYAIDALGREIVLTQTDVEPIPPVADDGFGGPVFFDLVLCYPDESGLKPSETRNGVCAPRGAIRLRESPVFCWVQLGPLPDRVPIDKRLRDEVQQGLRIRLARAQVLNCQLDQPLSLAQRRSARPAEQPYVASGSGGKSVWSIVANALGIGLQLKTSVDTSSAGFRTVPAYTVHLLGERQFDFTFPKTNVTVQRVLDGFVTLDPRVSGFDFSLLIPEILLTAQLDSTSNLDPRDADDFDQQLQRQILANHWRVEWMGVEG